MKYSGNLLFNVFPGNEEQKLNPMTRSIADIGGHKYAIYLNEFDGGVIVAVHSCTIEEGKPLIDRNPIAQAVADEFTDFSGYDFVFSIDLPHAQIVNFVVSSVRVNRNGTEYRLAQPLQIAKIRAPSPARVTPEDVTAAQADADKRAAQKKEAANF